MNTSHSYAYSWRGLWDEIKYNFRMRCYHCCIQWWHWELLGLNKSLLLYSSWKHEELIVNFDHREIRGVRLSTLLQLVSGSKIEYRQIFFFESIISGFKEIGAKWKYVFENQRSPKNGSNILEIAIFCTNVHFIIEVNNLLYSTWPMLFRVQTKKSIFDIYII